MSFRLDNATSLFVFLLTRVRVSCRRPKNRSPSCRISLCISAYLYFPPSPPPPLVFVLSQPCHSLAHSKQMSRYDSRCESWSNYYYSPTILPLPRAASTFARCHVKSSPDAKDACTCCVSACIRMNEARECVDY